jgi:hypothetical protein
VTFYTVRWSVCICICLCIRLCLSTCSFIPPKYLSLRDHLAIRLCTAPNFWQVAYGITLLSVCVRVSVLFIIIFFFSFSLLSVSYQRKVGVRFYTELLVSIWSVHWLYRVDSILNYSKKFPHLWNRKVHCLAHTSPPHGHILSRMIQVHIVTSVLDERASSADANRRCSTNVGTVNKC